MISKIVEKVIESVEKPGRYVGGEVNSVVKDKNAVDVRFAFCFPDIYEIGMSHIGLKILYGIFNRLDHCWCERVFAPAPDMEEKMRENHIPLYGLESGDPIADFDFIGFTLQYELSYTNILTMLDLAGVPLFASERTELKNIVIGGGPCACNPEPLADFFDLFCLGDGEEVDVEVIDLYRECKCKNVSKQEFLHLAARIPGVYVPSLYEISYNEDGTVAAYHPLDGAPEKIQKRNCMDLDALYFPKDFVVPFIDIVHDRASVEVLRGCIRGCRFCQAGFLYRPYREKSPEVINRQCRDLCASTGYDEIFLSSLSTSDHSGLYQMLDKLREWTTQERVSLFLPSLRVDGFSTELTDKIESVRRTGLTFAPEAGTQRLRDVINKNVTKEDLLHTVNIAFNAGWSRIRLYFMMGLPTETAEDIAGIADCAQAVVDVYDSNADIVKQDDEVTVKVATSPFIPKPFTPFQWFGQDSIESLLEKQRMLIKSLTANNFVLNNHLPHSRFIEAVFARGDRRLSKVLVLAKERGLGASGWEGTFKSTYEAWMQAFADAGIDPAFYATRHRSFDEVFPWDHLDYGVSKEFLKQECIKAYEARTTPNCKEECSNCGANCYGGGVCFEKRKNLV
ncbi:MAG: TIGR03960 family B12-binding radical SAM protein [Oscillospiraceae bacterium]